MARLRSPGQSPPAGSVRHQRSRFPSRDEHQDPGTPHTAPKSATVPREGAEGGGGHRSTLKALVRRCPRRRIHPSCTSED